MLTRLFLAAGFARQITAASQSDVPRSTIANLFLPHPTDGPGFDPNWDIKASKIGSDGDMTTYAVSATSGAPEQTITEGPKSFHFEGSHRNNYGKNASATYDCELNGLTKATCTIQMTAQEFQSDSTADQKYTTTISDRISAFYQNVEITTAATTPTNTAAPISVFVPVYPTDLPKDLSWQASIIAVQNDKTTLALEAENNTYTVTQGSETVHAEFSTSRDNNDIAQYTYDCSLGGTTTATCDDTTTHVNGPSLAYIGGTTLNSDEVAKHWTQVPVTAGGDRLGSNGPVGEDPEPSTSMNMSGSSSSASQTGMSTSGTSSMSGSDSSSSSSPSAASDSNSDSSSGNGAQATGMAKSVYKVVVVPVAIAIAGAL